MTSFEKILPIAKQITKKHDLCDNCLGRLFSKQLHLNSNVLLGKKIRKNLNLSPGKCYVCRNLLSNLTPYLKMMSEHSSKYQYSSILVGAMIKPSIIDRDDYIRSKYKLRGIDSVKTDITKELSKLFTKKTGKKVDFLDPDITFTINFKDETCNVRSKSVSLSGRYNKLERGFTQKQKSCSNCFGKGCRVCNYHGIAEFDSVEGKISEFLFLTFGGTSLKFTWVGGEDKSSLVLGSGRPFFVKIQNPLKRKASLPKKIKSDFILIHNLKMVSESPKKPSKFTSVIEAQISTKNEINSEQLRKLKDITKKPVIVYEKSGKRSEKQIFDLKYKKTSKNSFSLIMTAEGGLPVKRFVESDDVTPGVRQILKNPCSCTLFDFHEVFLK